MKRVLLILGMFILLTQTAGVSAGQNAGPSTIFPPAVSDSVYKVVFRQPLQINPAGGFAPTPTVLCIRRVIRLADGWFESDFKSATIDETCDANSFPAFRHGYLNTADVREFFFNPAK